MTKIVIKILGVNAYNGIISKTNLKGLQNFQIHQKEGDYYGQNKRKKSE